MLYNPFPAGIRTINSSAEKPKSTKRVAKKEQSSSLQDLQSPSIYLVILSLNFFTKLVFLLKPPSYAASPFSFPSNLSLGSVAAWLKSGMTG